jgi:hypothetical protein
MRICLKNKAQSLRPIEALCVYLRPDNGKHDFLIRVPFLGIGLVVQLVRIHACHAWGREFESRPDRPASQEANARLTRGTQDAHMAVGIEKPEEYQLPRAFCCV